MRNDAATPGHWYVAQCITLKEAQTAYALRTHVGLNVYLPQVSRRTRGEMQPQPLFPGYLFVQADLRKVSRSSINSTFGMVRLLEFGGVPQPLPESTVVALRERVDDINAKGGLMPHNFQPGDAVRIKAGPLRGLEAVFLGPMTPSARVNILLQFLGRLNQVKVEVDVLERVSTPGNNGRNTMRRSTRGRGRKINHGPESANTFQAH
jgi:transcriptional antiterminator RfaH